jgi:hypothetical protein
MARHGKQFLAVAEVCALYNSPWQVFYSPWRALQVLTRILAMAGEWARHGKIIRSEPVYFEKFSNHSFYVRMQLDFHKYV